MVVKRRPIRGDILFQDKVGDFTFMLKKRGLFRKDRYGDQNDFYLFYKDELIMRKYAGMNNRGKKNYDYFISDDKLFMYHAQNNGLLGVDDTTEFAHYGEIFQLDLNTGDILDKKYYMVPNFEMIAEFNKLREKLETRKDKDVTKERENAPTR